MTPERRRRAAELVALAVVLVALARWAGTDVSLSVDEPAAILQARRLAEGRGWLVPNPLPAVDPGAEHFYLVLSDREERGIAPYARHPAYPLVLAAADRVGGQAAMVGLSILGAVVAAAVTAALTARLDPRLGSWGLWAAGVGSPLLFDSQLVIAHTLGAALAGGAVLAALGPPAPMPAGGAGPPRPDAAPGHPPPGADTTRPGRARVVSTAVLLAAACLVRTEAVLLALVLGGWAGLRARRPPAGEGDGARRRPLLAGERRGWAVAAAVWAGVGPAVLVAERWALAAIVGGGVTGVSTLAGRGPLAFLATRPGALVTMLVAPGDTWVPTSQGALFAALAAAVALGLLLRRGGRAPVPAVVLVGAAGVAAAALPLRDAVPGVVPGILVACPLITVGLVALDPPLVGPGPARALAGIVAADGVAVAATQYAQGGGVEWGARYLALVLPPALALAVYSVDRAARAAGPAAGRAAVAAVAGMSVALAALGAWSLRATHDATRRFAGHLAGAVAAAPGPDLGDGDRRPIVVTTWFAVGRLTSVPVPGVRGLTAESGADLAALARRLDHVGVRRFVLVSEEAGDLASLAPRYGVAARTADARIMVLEVR